MGDQKETASVAAEQILRQLRLFDRKARAEIANDESTTYTLALVDFVYYGGTGVFSLIHLPATFGRTVDEALVDYITDNSGTPGTDLVPTADGRIDIQ